jgi:hypothetical protein
MSQSGHSRHFGCVPVTSDLPLRTDMVGPLQHVGKVPTRDSCIAAKSFLFDHLVGEREQRGGKFDTNRFCRLEVDHQLELGWLNHW